MTDDNISGYTVKTYEEFMGLLAANRESRGLTYAELSDRMGTCYLQQVWSYLNGAVECKARRIFELAEALEFDIALIPRHRK